MNNMQMMLESFTPEVSFALENIELINDFRVYRKSAASAQTEEQITMDGPLYTDAQKKDERITNKNFIFLYSDLAHFC